MAPPPTSTGALRSLPRTIWMLGVVSLLMDTSSELVHSLLPLFMTGVLGASMTTVGLVEGVAEATASITKVFSGALSDALGRRKLIVVLGYGLAAASKPVFPLARSISWVLGARFVDRVGKGIRGAPRDALIADWTAPEQRGAAYGLRQALDTVGAVLGPLLAMAFLALLAGDLAAVLWVAAVPAALAVPVLVFGVHEPAAPAQRTARPNPLAASSVRLLPARYWGVLALGAVFSLGRFGEAFLLLRAADAGMGAGAVPLALVAMNVVYAAVSYPAGSSADRVSPRALLLAGLAALAAANLILAVTASPATALLGAGMWGLHLGLTQGLFGKLVAGGAPAELRATAFGMFHLVSGLALLAANLIAGMLWTRHGASATFLAGAGFAVLAALGLGLTGARKGGRPDP